MDMKVTLDAIAPAVKSGIQLFKRILLSYICNCKRTGDILNSVFELLFSITSERGTFGTQILISMLQQKLNLYCFVLCFVIHILKSKNLDFTIKAHNHFGTL